MKRTLILLSLCASTLAAACSGSTSATAPTRSLVGVYQLASVNGMALPATLNVSGYIFTYTSGTLQVADTSYQLDVCIFDGDGEVSRCGTGFQDDQRWGEWWNTGGGTATFLDEMTNNRLTETVTGGSLTIEGALGATYQFTR